MRARSATGGPILLSRFEGTSRERQHEQTGNRGAATEMITEAEIEKSE
jgi:hypothetical protein